MHGRTSVTWRHLVLVQPGNALTVLKQNSLFSYQSILNCWDVAINKKIRHDWMQAPWTKLSVWLIVRCFPVTIRPSVSVAAEIIKLVALRVSKGPSASATSVDTTAPNIIMRPFSGLISKIFIISFFMFSFHFSRLLYRFINYGWSNVMKNNNFHRIFCNLNNWKIIKSRKIPAEDLLILFMIFFRNSIEWAPPV